MDADGQPNSHPPPLDAAAWAPAGWQPRALRSVLLSFHPPPLDAAVGAPAGWQPRALRSVLLSLQGAESELSPLPASWTSQQISRPGAKAQVRLTLPSSQGYIGFSQLVFLFSRCSFLL